VPYLVPAAEDPNREYVALVSQAVEGKHAFATKRETIDEYGWRHFGDLYADHEAVRHNGPAPLVSHYNNQYDAVAGLTCQFFRSGDLRWLEIADDLADHVIDVDVYHTLDDKPAYNRGLFWHTYHYTDADLAAHRTYPRRGGGAGGGPSAEHNYSTGLMLRYFLSGDGRARDTAVDLGRWVIDMDDGGLTPLRWIASVPTGLASATGTRDYHGPGRGSGNSIVVLLNAYRLTGERQFLSKAEALLRRCVHPSDDIAGLNLLDAERRWYYTVFFQAVGRYLDAKIEMGELDGMYAYGREALLHYARWMAAHEYPYLEKPEILEFPTETWVAQDMRKSEVFKYALKHAASGERETLAERAKFFFEYSVRTLCAMDSRGLTRPVVLLLSNGYMQAFFERAPGISAPAPIDPAAGFGSPGRFVPQRTVAMRRLIGGAFAALLGLGGWLAIRATG
jgi:hypothetical protein